MSIEHPGRPPGLAERLDELLLRLDDWRARPGVVLATGLLLVSVTAAGWWLSRPAEAVALGDSIPMAQPDGTAASTQGLPSADGLPAPGATAASVEGGAATTTEVTAPEPDLVVHVVGAVRSPGLVQVPPGSRLSDVVIAAGGPLPEADTQRLNLAAPAADGMQVRVPLVDEEPDEPLIVVSDQVDQQTPSQAAGPVNLNDASQEQLEALPGIGPAIATAIIGWREENGRFARPDDLMEVPGIGPAKMGALRDHVTT